MTGISQEGRAISLAVALLSVAAGCATVDPTQDYESAREMAEVATGEPTLYQPGEEEAARALIEQHLQEGLTAEESVQIALLNNVELREALFEIGLAHADAVQAGLLSNPSLAALVRIPLDGGSTNIEAGLVQNLIDLWHIPAKERLAEIELEYAVQSVAHQAARLAADAKSAYFSALAAQEAELVATENLDTAESFLSLTLDRQTAGAATEVDVNAARSEFLEQELLVRTSRFTSFDARRQLTLLLGLELPPEELELEGTLAGLPDWELRVEDLIERAKRHRLDLRAEASRVAAGEAAVELEHRLFLRTVKAGVSVESEDGEVGVGPAVRLDLPIFDQNQAQIAKAEFRLARAERRLEGLTTVAMQEVRGAHARHALARDTVGLYQREILPLRRASLELAREAFAAGKTGFLYVLEAQSRLLSTRREYVEQLEALAQTVPELEAACGQPLEKLLQSDRGEQSTSQQTSEEGGE